MNRMIFLEPLWKLHVGYHLNELRKYPPPGYEFIIPKNVANKNIVSRFSNNAFAPTIYSYLGQFIPLNLIKSYTYSKISQVQDNCELVYCCNHLSFRNRPWIAELDAIWDPIGPSYKVFRLFENILEQTICSQYCRAVLTFSEFSRQIWLSTLKSKEARDKVSFLPRAVHSKPTMANNTGDDHFHLLFIGSANLAGEFEMRGGKEVLETFRVLNHNNPRVPFNY